MSETEIYNKTAKGRTRLRSGGEGLSQAKIEILIAIDGKKCLLELTRTMTDSERKHFLAVIGELQSQGLIHRPIDDKQFELPVEMIEVTELGPQAGVQAWAEATRGSRELKERGYYVHRSTGDSSAHPDARESLRVLVVDDDESIVQLLTLLLESQGYAVTAALDAAGAVTELRKPVAPDLVLLDVLLPGRDGFDILAAIRSNSRLSGVPVIMVTGLIGSEHVMKGLKYGADGYIFKPLEWHALYECIQAVTGR